MKVDMAAMTAATAAASSDKARDLLRCIQVSTTADDTPIYVATDTYVAVLSMVGDWAPASMLDQFAESKPVALFPAADVATMRKAVKTKRDADLSIAGGIPTLSCGGFTVPSSLPHLTPTEYVKMENLFGSPTFENTPGLNLATKAFGVMLSCLNEPARYWPPKQRVSIPFSLYFQGSDRRKPILFSSVIPDARTSQPVSVLGLLMQIRGGRDWV